MSKVRVLQLRGVEARGARRRRRVVVRAVWFKRTRRTEKRTGKRGRTAGRSPELATHRTSSPLPPIQMYSACRSCVGRWIGAPGACLRSRSGRNQAHGSLQGRNLGACSPGPCRGCRGSCSGTERRATGGHRWERRRKRPSCGKRWEVSYCAWAKCKVETQNQRLKSQIFGRRARLCCMFPRPPTCAAATACGATRCQQGPRWRGGSPGAARWAATPARRAGGGGHGGPRGRPRRGKGCQQLKTKSKPTPPPAVRLPPWRPPRRGSERPPPRGATWQSLTCPRSGGGGVRAKVGWGAHHWRCKFAVQIKSRRAQPAGRARWAELRTSARLEKTSDRWLPRDLARTKRRGRPGFSTPVRSRSNPDPSRPRGQLPGRARSRLDCTADSPLQVSGALSTGRPAGPARREPPGRPCAPLRGPSLGKRARARRRRRLRRVAPVLRPGRRALAGDRPTFGVARHARPSRCEPDARGRARAPRLQRARVRAVGGRPAPLAAASTPPRQPERRRKKRRAASMPSATACWRAARAVAPRRPLRQCHAGSIARPARYERGLAAEARLFGRARSPSGPFA